MSTCRNDDTKNVTNYRCEKNYVDVISEKEKKIVSDKMMKNIFGL